MKELSALLFILSSPPATVFLTENRLPLNCIGSIFFVFQLRLRFHFDFRLAFVAV